MECNTSGSLQECGVVRLFAPRLPLYAQQEKPTLMLEPATSLWPLPGTGREKEDTR